MGLYEEIIEEFGLRCKCNVPTFLWLKHAFIKDAIEVNKMAYSDVAKLLDTEPVNVLYIKNKNYEKNKYYDVITKPIVTQILRSNNSRVGNGH